MSRDHGTDSIGAFNQKCVKIPGVASSALSWAPAAPGMGRLVRGPAGADPQPQGAAATISSVTCHSRRALSSSTAQGATPT